jgi:hypothetical protein
MMMLMRKNNKAQLQTLFQPRVLFIVIFILAGYLVAPILGVQKEVGILLGLIVGFILMRVL